jgi:hypothetical protein
MGGGGGRMVRREGCRRGHHEAGRSHHVVVSLGGECFLFLEGGEVLGRPAAGAAATHMFLGDSQTKYEKMKRMMEGRME